jgi:hypothetical protein
LGKTGGIGRIDNMSKYEPLWKHLQSGGSPTLKLTYAEIEAV